MNEGKVKDEDAEGFIIAQRGRRADLFSSRERGRERGYLEPFSQLCWYSRTVVRKSGCQRLMHSTMGLA